MKTLNDLTPEKRELIEVYKAKAREFYNGSVFNREKNVEFINYVFEEIEEVKKPLIIFADTPGDFKVLYEKMNKNMDIGKMHKKLNKGEDVSEWILEIEKDLDPEPVKKELSENKDRSEYIWLLSSYARCALSWYHFINQVMEVHTEHEKHIVWLYERVMDTSIVRVHVSDDKKYIIVLKNPQKIKFNEQNSLHNIYGPAIQYGLGEDLFYVNGTNFTPEQFSRLESGEYTFEEFSMERNEEVKSAVIRFYQERFGDEYVFNFIRENLQEMDTYTDKKDPKYLDGTTGGMNVGVYTLFKGEVNGTAVAYVRCYCPSTDRMFFLPCNPSQENAKDAIASLCMVPESEVENIEYIQRQGERFTIRYTPESMERFRSGKVDHTKRVSLTGDVYFSKMRYEY